MTLTRQDHERIYGDLLNKLGHQFKIKGDELSVRHCVFCKGNQKDEYTLGIDLQKGVYNCLRASCGVKGNLVTWLHEMHGISDAKARADFLKSYNLAPDTQTFRPKTQKVVSDFTKCIGQFSEKLPPAKAIEFAKHFDISVETVSKIGLGFNSQKNSFYYPMLQPDRTCHGVAWRAIGKERGKDRGSMQGSHFDSLFGAERLSNDIPPWEPLVLMEGASDYWKALDDGIRGALGRFNCGVKSFLENPQIVKHLEGRDVILVVDNDASPEARANTNRSAREIADGLYERGVASVHFWRPVGAKDYREWRTKNAVQEFLKECRREIFTKRSTEVSSHNSLISQSEPPNLWPSQPDDIAYYGLAGDIVDAIDPHTEAAPIALLIQLFIAFGNAIGRGPYFRAEADFHYTNLYIVLIGRTSKGRKGTSWGYIKRLFETVAPEWASTRILSGLSSGEGLIHAVRDPSEIKTSIKHKGTKVGEKPVQTDQGVSDKRLLVYESEFASVLRVIEREGNTLSAVVRQAWDCGELNVLTKQNPGRATGAHISIVGHITQGELQRYLGTTEIGNGFGNRFLWCCVDRSKTLPEGGNIDEVDFTPLEMRLEDAIKFAYKTKELKRDSQARELWIARYPELSEGKDGIFGALTSRAEAQVMRLATLYALLDCSSEIRLPHLQAALALWDYTERSVRYVFGNQLGDPVADEILKNLEQSPDGLTRTEISNLFKRHIDSARLSRTIDNLSSLHLIGIRQIETGGRPCDQIYLLPKGEISEKSE